MLIILKEIEYLDGTWEPFGAVRVDYPNLYHYMQKTYDPVKDYEDFSKLTKAHIKFYDPKYVYKMTDAQVSHFAINNKGFDKVVGCFPFDFASQLRHKDDILSLKTEYGISGYRIVVFDE